MEIKNAFAGTLESGDILIQIEPSDTPGLTIDLESTVAYQFGDQIKKVIADPLKGMGIGQAYVRATDKGGPYSGIDIGIIKHDFQLAAGADNFTWA